MIHDLIENSARKYTDKIAIIDDRNKFSFSEIDILTKRLANRLLQLGLCKGDVVAVQLPNSWEYIITHLALSRVGLIFNPLSPFYRKKELTYMLSLCNTKAFITIDTYKEFNHEKLALELKTELPDLDHIIVTGNPKEKESVYFEELIKEDIVGTTKENTPVQTDPALIMFTSGTESNPKAVLHTYQSFITGHLMNAIDYQLTSQDRFLSLTPLCHMFSIPHIFTGIALGFQHYILRNYQVQEVISLLERENITFLTAAPAHLIDIVHFMKKHQKNNLNLRVIQTGGSKIPSQLVKDLRKLTNATVISQWGMTEICAGTFTRPNDEESFSWETVGKPTRAGNVMILDDNYQPVPNKETGEIAFKGDCVFQEYYKNEEATSQAFTEDGYFLTGDLGWLDDDGYLHFVGRKKDTINRGGLKYHASEIEEYLLMHPKIKQAAIVSVQDDRLGERACVFVSLRNDHSINLEEIKKFLLDKGIAIYKLPEFLEVREELPTTPSGKVSKGPLYSEINSMKE